MVDDRFAGAGSVDDRGTAATLDIISGVVGQRLTKKIDVVRESKTEPGVERASYILPFTAPWGTAMAVGSAWTWTVLGSARDAAALMVHRGLAKPEDRTPPAVVELPQFSRKLTEAQVAQLKLLRFDAPLWQVPFDECSEDVKVQVVARLEYGHSFIPIPVTLSLPLDPATEKWSAIAHVGTQDVEFTGGGVFSWFSLDYIMSQIVAATAEQKGVAPSKRRKCASPACEGDVEPFVPLDAGDAYASVCSQVLSLCLGCATQYLASPVPDARFAPTTWGD